MEILNKSVHEISSMIRGQEIKAEEVAYLFLSHAEKINHELGAFISFNKNLLIQARVLDQKIKQGKNVGLLAGVPLAIKDNICTQSLRTTAASKMLSRFIPPYSATLVEKLLSQDALILGKTNLDEFAMGSSTETSAFGVCRNPWKGDFVPGGSSGGSAVAVATRMSPVAIGTDTGGSIRQPASFCGIVGLKPTYGRVSRYGIIAYASSLDQAGPMGRSIKDVALTLDVITGKDDQDSTSLQLEPTQCFAHLNKNIEGLRVGCPKQYESEDLAPEIKQELHRTKAVLKELGVVLVDIDLTYTHLAVPTYYLVATSEASSNLARYDGIKFGYRTEGDLQKIKDLDEFYCITRGEGFGEEVKRRIILGTYALSSGHYDAYFHKAAQIRRLIRDEFINVFNQCDVILSPVTATLAFKIGDRINSPLAMYLNDIFTTSANLAGLPAMSFPMGLSLEGLPVGVQFIGPPMGEQTLLNVGWAIEETGKSFNQGCNYVSQ